MVLVEIALAHDDRAETPERSHGPTHLFEETRAHARTPRQKAQVTVNTKSVVWRVYTDAKRASGWWQALARLPTHDGQDHDAVAP